MDIKQQKLEKERLKALGDLLIDECKASYTNMDSIETILQSGADIDYKNSKPLYWACKLHKYIFLNIFNNYIIAFNQKLCKQNSNKNLTLLVKTRILSLT